MPLLDGKLDIPNFEGPAFTVDDENDDTKFFRVARTGEVFSTYEDYTHRLRQLTSRNWSSSLSSGKDGLSYEQAMLEDKDVEALLAKVSTIPFWNPLLRLVSYVRCQPTRHQASLQTEITLIVRFPISKPKILVSEWLMLRDLEGKIRILEGGSLRLVLPCDPLYD